MSEKIKLWALDTKGTEATEGTVKLMNDRDQERALRMMTVETISRARALAAVPVVLSISSGKVKARAVEAVIECPKPASQILNAMVN